MRAAVVYRPRFAQHIPDIGCVIAPECARQLAAGAPPPALCCVPGSRVASDPLGTFPSACTWVAARQGRLAPTLLAAYPPACEQSVNG